MSKTLFWYLFRDLLRIFFMTSGTLAGIMSFGGLLRPLTENGLDAGQVGKMLTYLTPAMMTYSLPVAALFATTVIYGRLAADNELTACRAAGISYTVIGLPAVVLGLIVAILSLLLLCFIVPVFSLKVEQVIYSNLGKVVVNKIERNHQIRFGTGGLPTVFAQEARLLKPDPAHPRDELVELVGPTIVTYEMPDKVSKLRVPKEFYTAESAVVRIHPSGTGPAGTDPGQLSLDLAGGTKFPRRFVGDVQAGVDATTFGPITLASPIRENVKFMDIRALAKLTADPTGSQRVTAAIADLVRRDEETTFLFELAHGSEGSGAHVLRTGGAADETYLLSTAGPEPTFRGGELVFSSAGGGPHETGGPRQVHLEIRQAAETNLTAEAREVRVKAKPDDASERMVVTLEAYDLTLQTRGDENNQTDRATWARTFDVPMDEAVKAIRRDQTLDKYLRDHTLSPDDANHLRREQVVVSNAVRGELHSRASFAVSCLILVLVGCALGMMFRSGNFLSAFAVSFVPALLCITLVVAGQQTADHVPEKIGEHFLDHNTPLNLGLSLIWSGNVVVALLAAALVGKLRRR